MNSKTLKTKKKKNRRKINRSNNDSTRIMGSNSAYIIDGKRTPYTTFNIGKTLIAPDRLRAQLCFVDTQNGVLNNVGGNTGARRYKPTSAYDIDPTLGGTAMAGFNEWAALYDYYRVLAYTIEWSMNNQETFGVMVYSVPLNTDPGAAPSATAVHGQIMQPYCVRKFLSGVTGGNSDAEVKITIDSRQFVGVSAQRNDDSYASAVTTSPTNNIWHSIGIFSPGNVFVNGVSFVTIFVLEVEFYDRAQVNG